MAVVVAVWAGIAVESAPASPRSRDTLVGLGRRLRQPDVLRPLVVLSGATAALSAGVGFLAVVGSQQQLGPLSTCAIVSALAAAAAASSRGPDGASTGTNAPPSR